jgi:sugar phosphate isomerase/epimerase
MNPLKLGVTSPLSPDPAKDFAHVRSLGVETCQVICWNPMDITEDFARRTRKEADQAGVAITLFWCGYSGKVAWNYRQGPSTIGLVPPGTRRQRTLELVHGSRIAAWMGLPDMATHVGFLPPDPLDPNYLGTVESLKEIARSCKEKGLWFNFETGQETPVVLLRCIEDVGEGNLGINLDPANLLMYGNANPVDAVDVFGPYVRGVHAKDGGYPTEGSSLGAETKIGQGRVDFRALIGKLKAGGYQGALTIEREIEGDEQVRDIKESIEYLKPLL